MKNPFLNAVVAALYIVAVVLIINMFSTVLEGTEDTILAPMTMLSLLVLSVAIMGFLFAVEPLRLFLDNKRGEAVTFFLKTVGTFACFVIVFISLLVYSAR